ncbi:hypothetical protein LX24_01881 [Desulfallas thermosapovorans DSM 6562]|uniref:Uncharacterized protein n=1 Tax=Desulfallas thermosapovorans DSM 6562 TaxID=1121431 RepID=A0A5S4ZR12_9FIRM|nr:hypothetical protein LX24_01881 [Desulfallas thermosapovorans DSM 6562]
MNYKNINRDFRPYVLIGAITGIIEHMNDTGMSAEKAIEKIRAELKSFETAETAKQN